ncbi:MAG: glutaredoxin 3 [Gammaproteobacteria bacterium]|nr:MAG: glutaredoxin 3 [Gammaproteobacteria bacterium]RLA14325.1 MAG: glutaredoxin 3 [Gammaproteobacteria bacterium]RLA18118.1 MAG: glutaredoxin 3 [Gammaproteobacteria bacterium]
MSKKVIIYTGSFCGYCSAALRLLKSKNVNWEEIKVSSAPDLRAEMEQRSGRHTVPQIFIGDQHVGGYDDLADLEQRRELDAMLA